MFLGHIVAESSSNLFRLTVKSPKLRLINWQFFSINCTYLNYFQARVWARVFCHDKGMPKIRLCTNQICKISVRIRCITSMHLNEIIKASYNTINYKKNQTKYSDTNLWCDCEVFIMNVVWPHIYVNRSVFRYWKFMPTEILNFNTKHWNLFS